MVRKIGKTRKHRTRHHKATHRTHRRRRISGTKDITGALMEAASLGAGAIAGRELNTLLVKFFPAMGNSPLISGALQLAGGYMLPKLVKGSPFVTGMGKGMMSNGVLVMVVSTGIINGVRDRVSYRLPISSISGTKHLPVVNGTYLPVVNGSLPSNRTNRPASRKMRTVIR